MSFGGSEPFELPRGFPLTPRPRCKNGTWGTRRAILICEGLHSHVIGLFWEFYLVVQFFQFCQMRAHLIRV
jgi:hypothetical protein